MCGIAGFYLREEADSKAMATKLLDGIEHRGRHATGVAYWSANAEGKPTVMMQKAPVPARQFVKSMAVPEDVQILIGHTRAATQGPPEVNENNHPVTSANTIIGVHNGCIYNDEDLWKAIGPDLRAAEVDSEVIMGGLYALVDGQPDTKQYGPFLNRLEGSAAIAWLDTREPNRLHLAKVRRSPVFIGWTEAGSLVFASTKVAMEAGAKAGDLTLAGHAELDEGELFHFGPEGTEGMENFDVPDIPWSKKDDWQNNQLGGGSSTTSPPRRGGGRSSSTSARSSSGSSTRSSTTGHRSTDSASRSQSAGSGREATEAVRRGFSDDALRLIQSHSDALRGLSAVPIKEEERKHGALYEERESNIQTFVENEAKAEEAQLIAQGKRKEAEKVATEAAFDRAEHSGAFAREGDWVSMTFDGTLRMGQIVSMPQTFPAGKYLVRLYFPKAGGHDTCMVSATWTDLEYVESVALIDAAKVLD